MQTDQIIQAARVSGRKGEVYCLGPFPQRVSFSAQQHRALNLIWALHEKKSFVSGDAIAVIGAGVAGLTAAAGFLAYGCHVDIYETGSVPLARQKATEHRMVHPTVNQWPDRNLELTTTLPFLEWYFASCSEIAELMVDQFERMQGNKRLLLNRKVEDINDIATDLIKLVVKPPVDDNPTYRLVLIAIGFGSEREAPGFAACDYWMPDGLEIARDQRQAEHFIVSGCGDGGLIDALRLVHRDFRKGRLVVETANKLSGSTIAARIKAAEDKARATRSDAELEEAYERCAIELKTVEQFAEVDSSLEASLRGTDLVELIARDATHPYQMRSAPIHKLLIAHAIRSGRIRFTKGTAVRTGGGIDVAQRPFPAEPQSRVVIRHGSQPDFGRLLLPAEIAELKNKQEQFSDFHADRIWTAEYRTPDPFPVHRVESRDFMQDRKKLAVRALRSISDDAQLMITENGYQIQYDGTVPVDAPMRLFGVKVESRIIASSEGIP